MKPTYAVLVPSSEAMFTGKLLKAVNELASDESFKFTLISDPLKVIVAVHNWPFDMQPGTMLLF